MPRFSAFTPFGMLAFSSKPSHAENIYRSLVDNLAGAFDMSKGTHAEASAYARAMSLGRARYTLERAGNQSDPLKATEILPNLEQDYDVRPPLSAGLFERRTFLAAQYRLPRGGVYTNVRAALQTLLGTDFLAYRLLGDAEAVDYPTNPLTSVEVNAQRVEVPGRFLKLTQPMISTGLVWADYENLDTTAGDVLINDGDVVMVQPENSGLAERVTVTQVQGASSTRQFRAIFTKPHDVGAIVTTANWPYWWSTKRFALIVLKAASALSADKRRQVNELMAKLARGVSQWAIVQPSPPGATTVGPLTLPAPLGTATLGPVSFSLLP